MEKQNSSKKTAPQIKEKVKKSTLLLLFRAVIYLLLILLSVVFCAFIALQTSPVKDVVTRILTDAIAKNTRATCHIDELSGNLLSRFSVSGVQLSDAETGEPLISANRIDVSYSIPMLLGRVLWINRLMIDGVSVNLLQAKDGAWNFEMLAPKHPPKPPLKHPSKHPPETLPGNSVEQLPESPGVGAYKIEIRRLLIRKSDVTLAQRTDEGEVIRHFKGIECQASLDIGKEIFAKIKQLAVRLDNPRVDLTGLTGEIRYDFGKSCLNFKDTKIKGRKSDFTVNGLLSFLDHGPDMVILDMINMDLRADIQALSLGEFGQAFPIQMPDEDIVSGNICVRGPVSKMDCRLDLRMDTCHVESQGQVTIDEANNVGLDIAGKIRSLDLSALPVLDLKSFPSDMNTDFSITWQQIGMPDQTGRINLDLASSRLWDYLIDEAKLDVRIAGADFLLENLRLKTPYGQLAGSGSLAGILSLEKDNQIQFTADIEGFNSKDLVKNNLYTASIQYDSSINGIVHSTIFIPKTFAPEGIAADATCRINPSRMMNIDILAADFDVSWRDEKITLKRFDLETGLGIAALTGAASIKDETCRFKASATLPDLTLIKPFIPDMPDGEALSGSVSVTADINGSWGEPNVTAVVNADKLIFRDVSADSLTADGHWKGGPKDFSVSVECGVKNIRSNGLQIPVLNFKTTMTPVSIQADVELQGRQKEEFTLSGNISHWLEPVKDVNIEQIKIVSFDQPPLVNPEPVKLTISSDRIEVTSLSLASGDAFLSLDGYVGLTQPTEMSAVFALKNFNLHRISGFWEGGEGLHGQVSSDIQLSGLLEAPAIEASASIQNASYDDLLVSDITAFVRYDASEVTVSATAHKETQKILDVNGSASISLSLLPFELTPQPGKIDLSVKLDPIAGEEIFGFWKGDGKITGLISSDLQLSGFLDKPVIDVNFSVKDASYDDFSVSDIIASVKYDALKAVVTATALRGDKKLLDVDGAVPIDLSLYPFEIATPPDGLDLTMNIDDVDVSLISDLIAHPEYGVDGLLNGTAGISGDIMRPEIQGRMQLDNGSLSLKKQGLVYESLTADFLFEPGLLEISEINIAGDKEGVLQLSGSVAHDHFRPGDFNIRAIGDNFYVPFHRGVDARIKSDLILTGNRDAPKLTGKITITKGRVNLDWVFEKQPSDINIVQPLVAENGMIHLSEDEPEPLAFMGPLASDVTMVIPNDCWLKGKDELIEIMGNVQLKKDPYKPFVFFGSLNTVRGTYQFHGRLFQIIEGELNFVGQEQFNPPLNIEAATKIKDVTIIIRLTGTFQQLDVILDSDPVMSQAEIISYLIYGRASDDLSEEESFNAEEAALSFTGQIAANKIRDVVGDTFGIDYLSISSGSGGLKEGSLTMGKYVTPKVFVIYRQDFDDSEPREFEITYEINKYFDLQTEFDNEETAAFDLIWKYEF
ncbi:MAG: hypothetical protein HF978_07345 [Desulfobacteraceae bacterium]|nr:translocation/assembly module TamB domain-containing protein [Desulfobacteraceae bacterium]MBC2755345.1 hypothetical protein [Desulfobacteraceae bacterium]